ncbi:hypothetical protein N7462_005949 [Penicillium macrosclerotiorum]|uniref:uncharacterized protein n=1 Tax=Penicillium macrosclerotiorum TaxID=303699 RepID=UPI002549852B|nr:uncharacterized protein N7462_005949 [Penicillium macrosclerotiorum]KAJ5682784.1 hypothetical protein N7462_005949 [Penicillium macrosclerotiorum]
MAHEPLHGSCSCGRNQYRIQIPDDVTDHAQVYFDSSRDNRRLHGTPLTAWLRVPLDWYHSYTLSFFPDETHSSIRRIFTPHHAPQTRRIFCGFCGTPLTFWTEEPEEEASFMSVSVGSLSGEDQRALEDLELLPEEIDDAPHPTELSHPSDAVLAPDNAPSSIVVPSIQNTDSSRSFRHGTAGGIPWFEEMVEGSRLGRLMRSRRGMGMSDDQSTSIEWEVSEWVDYGSEGTPIVDSDSNGHATGKRKREQHIDA